MPRSAKSSLASLGVCVKNLDGVVISQNRQCRRICGAQVGKRCQAGCMPHFEDSRAWDCDAFDSRFQVARNIDVPSQHVDALIVNDGECLTTVLYSKNNVIAMQMDVLKKYDLSKSETEIAELVLIGLSNRQIAKRRFISRQTLRTHLNNIYKKVPSGIRERLQSIHSENQTREK